MKGKILIFALLVLSLATLAGHHEMSGAQDPGIPLSAQAESEISSTDDSSEAYIRYNCAFSAPSGSAIGTQRNNNFTGLYRTVNFCRRHLQRLCSPDMILKDGKFTGPASIRSFRTFLSSFPSGLLSEYHHFISLHKILI